jgi:hypothetical protein
LADDDLQEASKEGFRLSVCYWLQRHETFVTLFFSFFGAFYYDGIDNSYEQIIWRLNFRIIDLKKKANFLVTLNYRNIFGN